MVPELRKRHRLFWRLASLPLLGGFLMAIWSLPYPNLQKDLPVPQLLFSQVLQTVDTAGFTVQVRANETGTNQLAIEVTAPLSVFSALVYSNDLLLGSLGAKGQHVFILDSLSAEPPMRVSIKNALNQSILYQTTLK
jgi:hypothetical protein